MGPTLSAADANRNFSAVLRHVRSGRHVVVTSHGRPVARIVPFERGDRVESAARSLLFARLRSARIRKTGRWTRDELYEVLR
jgi:prevent-host-death family protein